MAIVGTLDTKGEAVMFLADALQRRGVRPVVVDIGILGEPTGHAYFSRQDIAAAAGANLKDLVAAGDKRAAVVAMASGAARIIRSAYDDGLIVAAMAVGGAQGAAIGSTALQELPFGSPKLLLTTVASGHGNFEPYVGTTDMTLMHSVVDILGVDSVSCAVLDNAAAAAAGMALAASNRAEAMPPSMPIGATMLGLTTTGLTLTRQNLMAAGFEVVPFHANGTGGRSLGQLVEAGTIGAVLDYSTQEIVSHLFGGLFDAGPGRLNSEAAVRVPQLIVPGGTDYLVLGPLDSLTPEQRTRPVIEHNPNITLIRTTTAEMEKVGESIAERANTARGRVAVVVPTAGFSQADAPGRAFWDPEADGALVEAIGEHLGDPGVLVLVDEHINSAAFAKSAADAMIEVMA